MKKYRIGFFAKEMGVNTDFVKYYEKHGLITPDIDETNGYRYYSFSQARRMLEIRNLRNIGFSVQEISRLLDSADQDETLEIFLRKQKDLHKQIKRLNMLYDYCSDFTGELRCAYTPNAWYISKPPAYYFLPHTDNEDFFDKPAVQRLVKQWTACMPFVQSCSYIHYDKSTSENGLRVCHGLAVWQDMAEKLELCVDTPVFFIESRRCLEYHYPLEINKQYAGFKRGFEVVMEIAEKNHFVPDGDIFIFFITNQCIENNKVEFFKMYLPILSTVEVTP